ncbi:MAG: PepSY domain-containing protein [Rubellimicrobium sp.]|nr:PepSY domain-containing protein [Rubellimicrobium sp.]
MFRHLHRWPGLVAGILLIVLALSGAALSVFPATERLGTPQAAAEQSVADLAGRIAALHPGLEQIRRAPSGRITAWWFADGRARSAVVDPATGGDAAPADPAPAERWLTNLHRSLFLGDAGRLAAAAGAMALLVLALSGAALVARRTGGWRRWLSRLRGPLAGRIHVELARIAVPGLLLSSATALWMSASTFELLPDAPARATFPAATSGITGLPLSAMPALQGITVADLRSMSLADPQDAGDAHLLRTAQGGGYLDQGTGEVLAWQDSGFWQRVSDLVLMLHTGQGLATLGLVLGLAALSVPAMAGTGLMLWWGARRMRPRIRGNTPASRATTILLVGSEGGTTWGFAATLHAALQAAGEGAHVAAMAGFDPARFPRARRFIVMAATYGEGAPPASAGDFLTRIARLGHPPQAPLAVLGFGDRSFPAFCAYADAVSAAAQELGWPLLLPPGVVDRQSPQDFARWGRDLGRAMDLDLDPVHQPVAPRTRTLRLISRRDHGHEVQAPTAILRFALPQGRLWQRLSGRAPVRFHPGDLLGIVPPGSDLPRFYSLASASRDGFIEIVVRKYPGGLCSGRLMSLRPGDTVAAFLRPNPAFRPGRGRTPLILIGAGSGIGPLAGVIRANRRQRPVHLFFGMRHPESDFLYREELDDWQQDGRLTALSTARSRGERPHHVQDALRSEAAEVARLIRDGARVMVCGGRGMALGVRAALEDILAPAGRSPVTLKAEGRYVEDVF